MSFLTSLLLILDVVLLFASPLVLVVFLIIALVKRIKKLPAKQYIVNGIVYAICCLLGCAVVTWLLKMGISIAGKMKGL